MKIIIILAILLFQTNFTHAEIRLYPDTNITGGQQTETESINNDDIYSKNIKAEEQDKCNELLKNYEKIVKFKNQTELIKYSEFYIKNIYSFSDCNIIAIFPYDDLWITAINSYRNKQYKDFIYISNHIENNYYLDDNLTFKLANSYLFGYGVNIDNEMSKKYIDSLSSKIEIQTTNYLLLEYYFRTLNYELLKDTLVYQETVRIKPDIQKYFDPIFKFSPYKFMGENNKSLLFISKEILKKGTKVELWQYIYNFSPDINIKTRKIYKIYDCTNKYSTTKVFKEYDAADNVITSENYDKPEYYPIDPDSFDNNIFGEVCKQK